MLENIIFAIQSDNVVGPAERIEGAREYLGRGLSSEDVTVIIIFACIAAVFAGLILWAYVKQLLRNR